MITGLTGMSGAGKSTVCGLLARRGFTVIDCDEISRETSRDRDFLNGLERRFPENLLGEDGFLDRELTARAIFNDCAKLRLYDMIIFPYIVYKIMRLIERSEGDIILDAPTLFDSGLDMICGKIVGVTASLEKCAERLILRDGITKARALERLSAQCGEEFFRSRCDYIIENNGDLSDFAESAEGIADKLKGSL